jgi:16S rRNA (uracil1498-N3)-methyltransferase
MTLPVFWSADVSGDQVVLTGAEGRHAAVVRRIAEGERVCLTTGRGVSVSGPVTAVTKTGITVSVEKRWSTDPPSPRTVVVQALPKGERAELAVEMLTEVGVDLIVPWNAERSQVRVGAERSEKILAKWRAWAFEASKQSRRSWFSEVADIASTPEVGTLLSKAALPVVLHEEATVPITTLDLPSSGDIVIVVGPEGGLTAGELDAFAVTPVRLGDTVLRTSTAGPIAAAVLHSRLRTG